jgi:hypothetical protein
MIGAALWRSAVAVALVTGAFGLLGIAVSALVGGFKDRQARRRDVFAKALAACTRYQEMPYVVRRRRTSDPEGERIRISEELRGIQEDLTFYSAWTLTESGHVGRAYGDLVRQTREIAGGAIRDAWNEPPVQRDEDMNTPDLGFVALAEARAKYLAAVSRRLRFLGGGGKRPSGKTDLI